MAILDGASRSQRFGRFGGPEQLTSWAGLTPKHHESDTTVHRGRITKQGSRLVRWAAVEAVQRVGAHTRHGQIRDRIGARRGRTSVSSPPPAN
jgi:transposase